MYTLDNKFLKEDGSRHVSSSCYPTSINFLKISYRNLDPDKCIQIVYNCIQNYNVSSITIRKHGGSHGF